MRFFLSIAVFVSLSLTALSLIACADDETTAGIEIGNPSIADTATVDSPVVKPPVEEPPAVALALTAGFSVDYSDVKKAALTKSAADDEALLLDSFALNLSEVRTFASYYSYMPEYDAVKGLQVWPEENGDSSDDPLIVYFTKNSLVDEAFKNIDLLDGGYLKEIGVTFKPRVTDDVVGRVKIGDEYVPFVYDLSNFQSLQLRYHYSQIEIDSAENKANLSVKFRVKLFTKDVDFSSAKVSEDGIIYVDAEHNLALWNQLNERFVPSFQPLRYDFVNANGEDSVAYVEDIWRGLAADVNENTLINGNFKSPFTTDWILVTQYGGAADTSVFVEDETERIMNVDVTEGGDSSFSVQLVQENVALIEGVQYKCVFTIWSDVADSITARIGSYDTYETVGFSKHVYVGTSGASKDIVFTARKSDPFARFELNLGKKKRKFWIKEVQVIRLTK